MVMSALLDIRYALRMLLKAPKFTAMTLLVLIGGLSISLFTFSFLYTTVYKELPIPEGDTARAIGIIINGKYRTLTAYEYLQVKDQMTSFAEFGVYDNREVRISQEDAGKSVMGTLVRKGFFEFSRTAPILGRVINEEDTKVGATPVAVIGYQIWQNDFGGDEKILDRTIMLDGQVTEIIGVMPQNYRFPDVAALWLPLSDDVFKASPRESESVYGYVRLHPNVDLQYAEQELGQAVNQVHQQNVELYDMAPREKSAKIQTFPMAKTGGDGAVIFAFLNGVSWMILLLACINVGNLLLARCLERHKETAIRAALGAKTTRLVSQLMWEGIIIASLGGILSLLLVGAVLDYTQIVLQSWLPNGGAFWWHYGMDAPTLLMGVGFTLITIVLSSFLPAWRAARQDINATLRDGTRGAQSKKASRLSKILVTTQIFLVAILMLIGAMSGFISYKFINLELGDNYHDVMTARILIPEKKYPEDEQQLTLLASIVERVESHPNVEGVVTGNWMGPSTVSIDGEEYANDLDKPQIDTIGVIGDMATTGVHLVAGRNLSNRDKLGYQYNVLISQSMAKRYWPGESPLGKSFKLKRGDVENHVFVVGVVTDRMNPSSLFSALDSADEIYVSGLQYVSPYQVIQYRITPNTQQPESIFYRAMFDTDRTIELVYPVEPAMKNRNMMRQMMRLLSKVTFGTGFFALFLALVGIYGLTANTIAQRTHEIGIRRAIGAKDAHVISMFLKQGGRQLAIGLGLALLFFSLLAYGFHSFTEEIVPLYFYFVLPVVVVFGLSVVVMAAIYLPTRNAVQMEPSSALRYE